jgi:hypothetical protein
MSVSTFVTAVDNIMAKRKKTNNDLQNITQKTKDRATRSHKKHGAPEGCTAPATIVTFTPVMLLCGDMSIMRKGWNFDYDKRNISVSVTSLLAATLYQVIHDKSYKLWNIGST